MKKKTTYVTIIDGGNHIDRWDPWHGLWRISHIWHLTLQCRLPLTLSLPRPSVHEPTILWSGLESKKTVTAKGAYIQRESEFLAKTWFLETRAGAVVRLRDDGTNLSLYAPFAVAEKSDVITFGDHRLPSRWDPFWTTRL